MATAVVGQPAPNFALPGIRRDADAAGGFVRSDFTLTAERGHPVVVVFYPGDESAVCTAQLCSYQAELSQFTDLGAAVLAISKQGIDSHERFARKEGLSFPLLSDTQGIAVAAYGIGLAGLGLRRSVFVVDAQGVLRWKHVALVGATFRSVDVIRRQLEAVAA
ncbi:peroxiredoxin [uncultured Amnibacterium sp.]|uniref:peroxiredoxin n=1 Tax=uncultured Amnibacterium sp. TaxID=1631851 RepID=UPI0035CB6A8A